MKVRTWWRARQHRRREYLRANAIAMAYVYGDSGAAEWAERQLDSDLP